MNEPTETRWSSEKCFVKGPEYRKVILQRISWKVQISDHLQDEQRGLTKNATLDKYIKIADIHMKLNSSFCLVGRIFSLTPSNI